MLKKLYDPAQGQMVVAGLMSGSGSNLKKIIEYEKRLELQGSTPYHVAVIFSDNAESNAVTIGREYEVPVVVRDIRVFYAARGKPRRDMMVRREFDAETVDVLLPYGVNAAAYAGYMSIASEVLINAFLGVNVHPADLSIMRDGKRAYTGDHAVRDAILAGERELRSSTHIIAAEVDYGSILMISAPVAVELPDDFDPQDKDLVKRVSDLHQDRLKERGDWVIFPKTLGCIAQGRYAADQNGLLYLDEKPIPAGLRLEYAKSKQ